MATITERLQFLVGLNADDAVRGFRKVGDEAEKGLGKAEDRLDAVGNRMVKFGAGAMAFAGVAGVALFSLGQEAADLAETMNKSAAVFGPAADRVEDFGERAAQAIGQSKQQAIGAASSFGNMFDQLGIGSDRAADMSIQMTTLASDFASFHNADITQVLEAQTAAFRGEYDAVQKFVPTINAATVEQKALEMGLAESTKELTAQDKALATYQVLLDGAGQAMGDFAKTSDSAVNQQRIATAELANMRAELGEAVIPIIRAGASAIGDMASAFNSLPGPVKSATGGILAAGTAALGAAGSFAFVGGQIIKARDTFRQMGSAATTVVPVMAAAGVAAFAVGAAYAEVAQRKADLKARTDDLVAAMQAELAGQKDALEMAQLRQLADAGVLQALRDAGVATEDIIRVLHGENVAKADNIELSFEQAQVLGRVRAATSGAAEVVSALEKSEADLAEATGNTSDRISIQVEETSKLAEGVGEAVDASNALAAATDAVAEMAQNAADAVKEQQEALDDLRESTIDAEQAQRDLTREAWNVEDAVRAVNEKLAEGDLASRDAQEAMLDLKDAVAGYADKALDAAEKQATANGETITAEEKLRIQQDAAEELRDMMPGLTGAIDDYVASLDKIEREIKTVITIEEIDNRRDRRNDDRLGNDTFSAAGTPMAGDGSEILTPIDPELDRLNKEAEKKAEEARRAAEAAERAAQDRLWLYDELKDAEEDQRDAARDTAAAVAKLEEIRQKQPTNLAAIEEATDNANSALRDEIDAAVEAAEAQAALEGRTLTAAEMQSVMAGKLDELAGRFPSLIQQVKDYAAALGLAGLGGSSTGGSGSDAMGRPGSSIGAGAAANSLEAQLAKVKAEQEARIASGQGASTDLYLIAQALAAQIAAQRPVNVVLNVDGRELSTAQASASFGRVRAMGLG